MRTTARASVAEAKEQMEEAASLYAEAADGWALYGHVPERARSLLGKGRCLLGLGRTNEATGALQEARTLFLQFGAVPLVSDADAWLERATALSS